MFDQQEISPEPMGPGSREDVLISFLPSPLSKPLPPAAGGGRGRVLGLGGVEVLPGEDRRGARRYSHHSLRYLLPGHRFL